MPDTAPDMTPSYVADCNTCHKRCLAIVNDGSDPKWVAKEVSDAIKRGLTVTSATVHDVRTGNWCDCWKSRKKAKEEQLCLI